MVDQPILRPVAIEMLDELRIGISSSHDHPFASLYLGFIPSAIITEAPAEVVGYLMNGR